MSIDRYTYCPLGVNFEQVNRLGDHRRIFRNDTEGAAVVNVKESEIEGEQEEPAAIDDHHLAMITHELFGGARHPYTASRQTFFEPLDLLQIILVGVSDQCMDKDAAGGGFDQSLLDLQPVQSIDNDFNACFGLSDSFDQRFYTVAWLNDYAHLLERSWRQAELYPSASWPSNSGQLHLQFGLKPLCRSEKGALSQPIRLVNLFMNATTGIE